jgi:hypothetical protein
MSQAQPLSIGETQSILGLIKPCLEKAAAGRLREVESKQQVVVKNYLSRKTTLLVLVSPPVALYWAGHLL